MFAFNSNSLQRGPPDFKVACIGTIPMQGCNRDLHFSLCQLFMTAAPCLPEM